MSYVFGIGLSSLGECSFCWMGLFPSGISVGHVFDEAVIRWLALVKFIVHNLGVYLLGERSRVARESPREGEGEGGSCTLDSHPLAALCVALFFARLRLVPLPKTVHLWHTFFKLLFA